MTRGRNNGRNETPPGIKTTPDTCGAACAVEIDEGTAVVSVVARATGRKDDLSSAETGEARTLKQITSCRITVCFLCQN